MNIGNRYTGLIEKYRDRLPVSKDTRIISLGEGATPLIQLQNIPRTLGKQVEIYVKFEGLNPTGSFKDRGMTMAVTKAVEEGSRAIICASTGNTSASAAAYAARAGITCFVVIPDGKIALGKLAQAMIHGAVVIQIQGNFDVGMALVKAPVIAERIQRIVMMAGAYFEVGNVTPAAEFNVYVDPEAADVVMRSGIPITVLPLDVTHQVLSTRARIETLRALGNEAGRAVAEMLTFSEAFDVKKYGWTGAPLHDPNVIAWLLKPELYKGREINVSIETDSALTLGMTVADWWGVTDRPKNALFLRDVDARGFYALLTERLRRLP